MTFADPLYLHALWALLVVPLLYLVRRRARSQVVPHLHMWKRVMHHGTQSRARRIRDFASILLQVVIAASIILALAGPQVTTQKDVESRTLVIIDTSLSMGALTATGETRLERAVAEVRGRLADLVRLGDVSICLASGEVVPVTRWGRTLEDLEEVLENLSGPVGQLDMEALLAFLVSRPGEGDDRVFTLLITDGASPGFDSGEFAPPGVELVRVGDLDANAGIVDIKIEDLGDGDAQLEAVVSAFGASSRCRLNLRDGQQLLQSKEIVLGRDSTTRVSFGVSVTRGRWLTLEIEETGASSDVLAADDQAHVWWGEPVRARVLVVGRQVDTYLKRALDVLGDSIERSEAVSASPDDWRGVGDFDLVILDGVEEKSPLPPGRYLLLDSWAPGLPLKRLGETTDVVVDRQLPDMILRGIDLRDLQVKRARRITLEQGAREILRGSCGSLISMGKGRVSFVHVAFDTHPDNSSLVLLPAWPLLIRDTILALCSDRRRVFPAAVSSGAVFSASRSVAESDAQAWLEFEDETLVELDSVGPGPTLVAPPTTGRAIVHVGDLSEPMAVNVGSPLNSDIRSRLGDQKTGVIRPVMRTKDSQRSLAGGFVLAALVLGLLEWLLFHMGWTR